MVTDKVSCFSSLISSRVFTFRLSNSRERERKKQFLTTSEQDKCERMTQKSKKRIEFLKVIETQDIIMREKDMRFKKYRERRKIQTIFLELIQSVHGTAELWAWLSVEEGTVRFETTDGLRLPETGNGCSLTL